MQLACECLAAAFASCAPYGAAVLLPVVAEALGRAISSSATGESPQCALLRPVGALALGFGGVGVGVGVGGGGGRGGANLEAGSEFEEASTLSAALLAHVGGVMSGLPTPMSEAAHLAQQHFLAEWFGLLNRRCEHTRTHKHTHTHTRFPLSLSLSLSLSHTHTHTHTDNRHHISPHP